MKRSHIVVAGFAAASVALTASPVFILTKKDLSEVKVAETEMKVESTTEGAFSVAGLPLDEIASIVRAPEILGTPVVTVENVEATAVTVSWEPVAAAASYSIIVKIGETEVATATADAETTTCVIESLEPDMEYGIFVTAVAADADYNSLAAEVTATTKLWFSGGDGTEQNPWQIMKASQMVLMADLVNGKGLDEGAENPYPQQCYILTGDVDMSAVDTWTPVGTGEGNDIIKNPEKNVFAGEFNGNSHTITGFSMNAEGEGTIIAALFGAINNANIHDLALEGEVSAKANVAIGAGLVGIMAGTSSTIANCSFSGAVTAISPDDTATAAGLIGLHMAGEISDVKVTVPSGASITANGPAADAGGVAGYGNAGRMEGAQAFVEGGIEALSEADQLIATGQSTGAGAIIGTAFGTVCVDCTATISGSILSRATRPAEAAVATTIASAGGLMGHYAADMLQGATATVSGSITAEATDVAYAGGIVGQQARNGYAASGLNMTLEATGVVKAEALDAPSGNTGAYAGGMYGIVSFQTATGSVSASNALIKGMIHARSANSAMATVGGIAGSSGSISLCSVEIADCAELKADNPDNTAAGAITGIITAGNVTGCSAYVDGSIKSVINAGGLVGVASGTRFSKKAINGSYAVILGHLGAPDDTSEATPKIGGIVGLNNNYGSVNGCYWYAPDGSGITGQSGTAGASDTGRLADVTKASMEAAAEEMNGYLGDYQWKWDDEAGRLVITPVSSESDDI